MWQHMIACFLSNISAKYYKNPSMLSRVIAKNVGDVFLRHSVEYADTTSWLPSALSHVTFPLITSYNITSCRMFLAL